MQGYCHLVDVKGAFLCGSFDNNEEMYMEVPQGFEKYYGSDVVLKLQRTIYGTKQAAKQYWRESVKCFKDMGYEQSAADPCLYYKHTPDGGWVFWMSWVDDFNCIGSSKELVLKEVDELLKRFDCDNVGPLKEYVGNKIDIDMELQTMKFTQPVILDSFNDEFDIADITVPSTPMAPGTILMKGNGQGLVSQKDQKVYRSGVGKMIHVMRWSRPEICNPVRELSRHGGQATINHFDNMKRIMKYCTSTKNRGLFFKPGNSWNGDPNYEFNLWTITDASYAPSPDDRKSVISMMTFLEDCAIAVSCSTMKVIALSVTEAELYAAVTGVQDLMFTKSILESVGLRVALPMKVYIDNQGAIDLINNWSVGGRTRHIDIRVLYIRDMKAQGLIVPIYKPTATMTADLNTKNLPVAAFNTHIVPLVGQDEYLPDA